MPKHPDFTRVINVKWPAQRNQGPACKIKVIRYSGKRSFPSLIHIWKYHCTCRILQRKLVSFPTRKGPLRQQNTYLVYHIAKNKPPADCEVYVEIVSQLLHQLLCVSCTAWPKEEKGEDSPVISIFLRPFVMFSTKAATFKDAVVGFPIA